MSNRALLLPFFSLLFAFGLQAQSNRDTIVLKTNATKIVAYCSERNDSVFYRFGLTSQDLLHGLSMSEIDTILRYQSSSTNDTQDRYLSAQITFWERNGDEEKTEAAPKEQPFVRSKNAISGQLLGLGGIFSVGYDRVLWQSKKAFLAAGAGIGMIPFGLSVPHYISMNFGAKKHNFELGMGGTYMAARFPADNTLTTVYGVAPLAGYRLQSSKGFFLRTYLTALVPVYDNPNGFVPFRAVPYVGVDLGYSF